MGAGKKEINEQLETRGGGKLTIEPRGGRVRACEGERE